MACVDICPIKIISTSQNDNGFYVPKLSSTNCINCGKCVNVCPALKNDIVNVIRKYYYGWSKDVEIREQSSSGGVFSTLAQTIIAEKGVVCGAVYDDDFSSVIITSSESVDIKRMRTSKYVQSNSNGIFNTVNRFLREGKKVLMVGAPCQVMAARNFFGNNDNLYLVDFLCGGFASPKAFSQYISWLEKKYKSKIVSLNFRNKKKGWSKSGIRVEFENGRTYFSIPEYDPYYYYYFSQALKNDACIECKFIESRGADITIADFWGFRKENIKNDEKGMSLIVTHNAKGDKLLEKIKSNLEITPLTEKQGSYGFVLKKKNEADLQFREKFLFEMQTNDFVALAKKYHYKHGKLGVFYKKVIAKIKRVLKIK